MASVRKCLKAATGISEQDVAEFNAYLVEDGATPISAIDNLIDDVLKERNALVAKIEAQGGKVAPFEAQVKSETTPKSETTTKPKSETKPKENKSPFADTSDVGGEMLYNKRQKGLTKKDFDEAENKTAKTVMAVKGKLWTKPDYQEMVDSGIPAITVHVIKQIYDSLSAKPALKLDKYLDHYVDTVLDTKAAVDEFLQDKKLIGEVTAYIANELNKYISRRSGGSFDVTSLMSQDKNNDPTQWFLNKIFPANESGNRWGAKNELGNDRANATGNRFYKKLQLRTSDFLEAASAVANDGFPAKQEAWQRSYEIKEKDGSFFLYKKNRYRATSEHATKEEAIEAARELTKRTIREKFKEPETPVEKSVRKGRDIRDGKNVSTLQLQEATGLSKINFGNWMANDANAKERQAHVNSAYDAFVDLAEILNIPVKATSLNGMLSLAIGAQGKKGAAAHFVAGFNEINLTRMAGAGSLAHEWGHALDHYFGVQAGMDGSATPFLSNANLRTVGDLRPEVKKAFTDIMQAMKSSKEDIEVAKARDELYEKRAVEALERTINALDIEARLESEQLNSAFNRAEAKKALQQLRDGAEYEYTEWKPLGRRRKPEGYTSQQAYYIGRALGEPYSWAKRLNDSGISVYHAKQALLKAPIQHDIHTTFYKRAESLDFGKPYWSTPHELFARAFETYVSDKILEKGGDNTYLTAYWKRITGTDTDPSDADMRYPRGEERERINAAFDVLFNEIRSKEEGGNVALYSKGNTEGMSQKDATDVLVANPTLAKAIKSGLLKVVQSESEIPVGAELYAVDAAYQDSEYIYSKLRDNFLDLLPEDAMADEVMEMADQFSSEERAFLTALNNDDWLGFDYPAQAITAALTDNINNYDPSTRLKATIGRLVNLAFEGLYSKQGATQGAYLNGVAYVVADGNTLETVESTAVHELTHAMMNSNAFMSEQQRAEMLDRLDKVRKLSSKDPFWKAVDKRVKDANTPDAAILDETAGYAVTQYLMGNEAMPNSLIKWVKDFIGKLKAAWFKYTGKQLGDVTPQELIAMTSAFVDMATTARERTSYNIDPRTAPALASMSERFNTFFSGMGEAITNKIGKTVNAKMLATQLQNESVRGKWGIKDEEVQWTGIVEWLQEQKGSVSKQDIQDFIEANQVQVQEVMLGNGKEKTVDDFAREIVQGGASSESIKDMAVNYIILEEDNATAKDILGREVNLYNSDDVEELKAKIEFNDAVDIIANMEWQGSDKSYNNSKYKDYTVKGEADNYRELLLTTPVRSARSLNDIAYEMYGVPFSELSDEHANKVATNEVREKNKQNYRSSHWEQKNVIAHMRFDDRVDLDGNKILFIHEIQSDWHQEGRKKGYQGEVKPLTESDLIVSGIRNNTMTVTTIDGRFIANVNKSNLIDQTEAGAVAEVVRRMAEEPNLVTKNSNGVPDAPFKGNAWVMLAVKRMIRLAVEQGADQVAWATGKQSADLYSLRKRIETLVYDKREGLIAYDRDGESVLGRTVPESELADTIGKEAAEKLLAVTPNADGERILTGQELDVGGEGMSGFYDKTLPTLVQKYIKKWGAQIEGVNVSTGNGGYARTASDGTVFWLEDSQGNKISPDYTELSDLYDAHERVENGITTQLGFTITDAMRESVMKGQPLFSKQNDNFKKWFGGSKVVDKNGKPLVVYHSTNGDFTEFKMNFDDMSYAQFGAHFGSAEAANNRIDVKKREQEYQGIKPKQGGENVMPVYLSIKNPLRLPENRLGRWGVDDIMSEIMKAAENGDITLPQKYIDDWYDDNLTINRKNWFDTEDAEQAKLLMHFLDKVLKVDGIVYGNEFEGGGDSYLVWHAEQIKSATGNNGNFDGSNPNILFSRASAINDVISNSELADQVKEPFQKAWQVMKSQAMGILTLRQLGEVTGRVLPVINKRYMPLKDRMVVEINDWLNRGAKITNDRAKLSKSENIALSTVQQEATIAAVDPSKDYKPRMTQELYDRKVAAIIEANKGSDGGLSSKAADKIEAMKELLDQEEQRKEAYMKIKPLYDQLSNEAKAVYRDELNFHKALNTERLAILTQRINTTNMNPKSRAELLDKLKEKFESAQVSEPYFPLSRFGEFWVHSKQGEETSFDMFETASQRDKYQAQLEESGATILGSGKNLKNMQSIDGVSSSFIADVDRLISGLGDDPMVSELRKNVYDLYLATLPDLSVRKHFIRRKNTRGFNKDQSRSFADAVQHGSKQLGKLKYGQDLSRIVEDAERTLKVASSTQEAQILDARIGTLTAFAETAADMSPSEIQSMIDKNKGRNKEAAKLYKEYLQIKQTMSNDNVAAEIEKLEAIREDAKLLSDSGSKEMASYAVEELRSANQAIMNPNVHPFAQAINSFGFVWFLGLTPAAAMVNVTQTAIVGMPLIAAKYGFNNATKQLTQATKDFFHKGKDGKFSIEAANITADEKDAFKSWYATGLLDNTLAHDTAGIAENGVNNGSIRHKIMSAASYMFHRAEQFNREVTALAAYRAAREKGESHIEATKSASKITWDAHFDYTSANRARFLRGNVARVVAQFKQYSQSIIYLYGRLFHEAFMAQNPNKIEIAQARKALAGILGMQLSLAGSAGLPLAGVAMGISQLMADIFGDDDEPFLVDAEIRQHVTAALQNVLGNDAGGFFADTLTNGIVNASTPLNLSGRISHSDLVFRLSDRELSGRNASYDALKSVLGVPAAYFEMPFVAAEHLRKDNYMKAAETVLPKFMKDALKSVRYGVEDARTANGYVVKDMNAGEILMQLGGFSSSELAEQYGLNNARSNYDSRLKYRRSSLINKMVNAKANGGDVKAAQAEIDDWNKAHPNNLITKLNIKQSEKGKQRYMDNLVDGRYSAKRYKDTNEKFDWTY